MALVKAARTALSVGVTLSLCLLAAPAHAGEQQTVTLIDLSKDGRPQREIAHDVARALKRDPKVRYRSVDESLNVGGEDVHRNNARSAESLLRSAKKQMAAKEWEGAAEELESAVTGLMSSFAHVPEQDLVEEVFVLHGVALYLSGEKKMASKAFERAVTFHPTAKHDVSKWGAKVQAAFDAARDKILLRKPVTWEVRTEPPNAEVWVNGRYYGISPTSVRSFSGQQFVRLYKQGYARLEKVVQIKKDNASQSIELSKARRKPAFDSVLEGLSEIFDGAVEPNDLSKAQGLLVAPQAVVLHATGTRDNMTINLALANLAGRQVVKRVSRKMPWLRRDKRAIEKLVQELFKAPEIPKTKAPVVKSRSVLTRWWFWTAVGAAAIGATTAAILLSRTETAPPKYKAGEGGLIIRF